MAPRKKITPNTGATEEEVPVVIEKPMTTKKSTPKKAPATKEEPINEAPKGFRKFNSSDLIECKSITYGELLLPGLKSQLLYTWSGFGDVAEVEFQDLQALRSRNSDYLKTPYFLIEDEELLEQWTDLAALYSKIATTDAEKLFALPINQFKASLKVLPRGMRETIKNMASNKILNGSLDSIAKIKAIDEEFNTDLQFYIQ